MGLSLDEERRMLGVMTKSVSISYSYSPEVYT